MRTDITLTVDEINRKLRNTKDDREQCFLLVYQVFENGAFTNLLLKDVNDFVRAMFYGTVTYSHSIDFLIKHLSGEDVNKMDSVTRNILRMGVWQLGFSTKVPEHAAVFTTVELCKKYNKASAGYVNKVLRAVTSEGRDSLVLDNYRDDIKVSLKNEMFGILKKYYGKERAVLIGKAFLEESRLSIRVNTMLTTKDKLIKELEASGVKILGEGFCDECIFVDMNDSGLTNLDSFKNGEFFVQNEAAMLASIIANPKKGDIILDCCSAPGGKSTHMAQLTNDECIIDAIDIKKSRIELIKENSRRLKLNSINAMLGNSVSPDFAPRLEYDVVLCDVPCSGLGLLGRKPDIRLTITYERIEELLPTQQKILSNASRVVKPGGTLIYSTCTLNKRENELQVEEFLSNHPEFSSISIENLLPSKLKSKLSEERLDEAKKKGMITLTPDLDGTDGFFIAALRRKE